VCRGRQVRDGGAYGCAVPRAYANLNPGLRLRKHPACLDIHIHTYRHKKHWNRSKRLQFLNDVGSTCSRQMTWLPFCESAFLLSTFNDNAVTFTDAPPPPKLISNGSGIALFYASHRPDCKAEALRSSVCLYVFLFVRASVRSFFSVTNAIFWMNWFCS